jgi:aryl-alcohol dehydrogenase-like predicted oxidoreductase
VAQIALAWILSKPFVSTVIIGAKSMDQLRDNIDAGRWSEPIDVIRFQ